MSDDFVCARGAITYFRTTCKLLWLTLLAMLLVVPPNYGQNKCVTLVTSSASNNGVMTGAGIPLGGTPPCITDPIWTAVVPQLVPVVGTPDTQSVYLFAAGHSGGANLDRLYVGVHVQSTPNLSTFDHVTVYFHFGSSASPFASPDFALTYDIGATVATPDVTPPDAECSQDPATTTASGYYTFSGGATGNWSTATAPAAGITAKKSWNFVNGQPDFGIWELEIGLDLTAAGLNIAVPSSGTNVLSLGAKVYTYDGPATKQSTEYLFPSALTTDTDTLDFKPNFGSVTSPSTLQAFDVGTCSNDVMITAIKAADANGAANQFTRPPSASASAAATNQFSANLKFYNPANAFDNTTLLSPNTGQVEFHILPTNAGGTATIDDIIMATLPGSFTRLNQEITVPMPPAAPTFSWPNAGDWNTQGYVQEFTSANHACYIVKISPTNGFNVNVVDANDQMQENLFFTTNSIVRDSFLISAKDPKLQPHNGYIDYILRVKLRQVKSTKGWHFDFEDADDIGLKKIADGYYSLRLKPGEERHVKIELSGVLMPGTSQKYSVPATAGGTVLSPTSGTPPLDITVKPNAVMSIVARRLIQRGPNFGPNDANGVEQQTGTGGLNFQAARARAASSAAAVPNSLLKDGYYHSSDHQGALIGSFDGFNTAFVVGTDSTFVVPSNAHTLSLAINDQAGQYGDNTGYFQVNVAASDPVILPTAITQLPVANEGIPVQAASGTGLPRLDIDVMQSVPDKKLLIPLGYVSWAIYESHKRSPFWWLWPGNWT